MYCMYVLYKYLASIHLTLVTRTRPWSGTLLFARPSKGFDARVIERGECKRDMSPRVGFREPGMNVAL